MKIGTRERASKKFGKCRAAGATDSSIGEKKAKDHFRRGIRGHSGDAGGGEGNVEGGTGRSKKRPR